MTMEEELSISLDGKNLANLRVVDLKQELEKRGLSKSGSKKDLIKRLKQQLEFEKLCEERKSTGDCELKKELDARTQQNEFVQRYLAQQQKIFAEQKEVKRLVELEESQKKSSDTEEGVISSKFAENPSSGEDTEPDGDSESSSSENDANVADKRNLDKGKVQKDKVKDENAEQPSSDVIVKRHIIKIERDKVYTIVSNKNQDVSTESEKSSSKEALSEKECSLTGMRKENEALLVVKSKQTLQDDELSKSHSVAKDIEIPPVDTKQGQKKDILSEDSKNKVDYKDKIIKSTDNVDKIPYSNVEGKVKTECLVKESDKQTLSIKSTVKSAVPVEDVIASATVVEDVIASATVVEDTNKSAAKTKSGDKVEDTSKSSLETKDADKTALKVEDKNISSKTHAAKGNILLINKSTARDTFKCEDTDKSILKPEVASISVIKTPSSNIKNRGGIPFSVDVLVGESALKNETAIVTALSKSSNIGECSIKKEDPDEKPLKSENVSISALKNNKITASVNLKNKNLDESIPTKDQDVDKNVRQKVEEATKSVISLKKDADEGSFPNINISDNNTIIKPDIEYIADQTVSHSQASIVAIGQNESDMHSACLEKESGDTFNAQCKTEEQIAVESIMCVTTSPEKLEYSFSSEEKPELSEVKEIAPVCETSTCKENVQLSPSFHQKIDPVPESDIKTVPPSVESSKPSIIESSPEKKLVNMDTAVPYPLSDIQLPESPSSIMKPTAIKKTSKKETLPPSHANDSDKDSHSDNDVSKNGLNSSSRSRTKLVVDDSPSKNKQSSNDSNKTEEKGILSKSSKTSDRLTEAAVAKKSRYLKKEKNSDFEEKSSVKAKEKRTDSCSESSSGSSSSGESSKSNDNKKKRQPRSKHPQIRKDRSESSSSSSGSRSPEKTPEKLLKEESRKKKSAKSDVSSGIQKLKIEILESNTNVSSSSSQIQDKSHSEPHKKDDEAVLPDASSKELKSESSSRQRISKSRSRSPGDISPKRHAKSSKDNVEKLIELDASESSRTAKKQRSRSSDLKVSKSRSCSPSSSPVQERSPMKLSKENVKKAFAPDSSKDIKKNSSDSSSEEETSKSRSQSPCVSKTKEKSNVKQSKDDLNSRRTKKSHDVSDSRQRTSKSKSRSPSSSKRQRRDSKDAKKSASSETSKNTEKGRSYSIDKKTSKDMSRSPSSQSREGSSEKQSKDSKKMIQSDVSTSFKKDRFRSKHSKSRSRSPSSRRSQEKSPVRMSKEVEMATQDSKAEPDRQISKSKSRSPSSHRGLTKSSKEDIEKVSISDTSRTGRKCRGPSNSDQMSSKSRSRSSSRSPPPHHTLETFFSQNKKKSRLLASKSNEKTSADPPRKKLKINRNNIIIPSYESSGKDLAETSKEPPSSPKQEKELSELTSSNQLEVVEREMGEIIENSPEVKYEPRKINFPGRKLSRKSSEDLSNEPKSKKSKWGKFASSQRSSQAINISTDSLKNWFPEFKLVNEPSVVNELMIEESPPVREDKKLSFPLQTEDDSNLQFSSNASRPNSEEPSSEQADASGPVSKIVFIQNLVRPFTLLQLKDLLRQTGDFTDDDFWIDKIKSKCFVTYATEEEAIKTRNALNGIRWPSSNPKILSADFSTEEEFENHRSGKDTQKQIPERLPEVQETVEEEEPQPSSDHRRRDRDGDRRKEREHYRTQAPVREWDKDKVSQDSPDRERADKFTEGYRGTDRKDKKDTKKKASEETPAKLLDDLFHKTKAVPCIYWLPLTDAQLLEREESKRLRRLEREKRNQQREKEESEHRNKRSRPDYKSRETENRRSSSRSRSPTSRRR